MTHASSSSLLLLFCGTGICRDSTLYFLCFSFMCFGIPCWKMSNHSQVLLYLAKRVETFQPKKSLNSSGMDGTLKWRCGISAPCFPFILMCMVLGVSDVEEQCLDWKRACVILRRNKAERSCPGEAALKRGKRINGRLKHENVSVLQNT